MKAIVLVLLIAASLPGQTPPQSTAPEQLRELQLELEAVRQEIAAGRGKFTPQHHDMVQLERQYQDLLNGVGKLESRVSPLTLLQSTVKGTFWRDPAWVDMLKLTADQQTKMDDIFQQYRLRLIDLTASLQKEELILEPLMNGSRPSPEVEAKILTQIDHIAQARAELEKANSRMLVNILQTLTAEQWSKLPKPAGGIFTKKKN